MIKARLSVLIVLTVVFASGCGLLGVIVGQDLCQERADYENALIRDVLKPVLSQAELVAHDSQDINDCDSSTYGSHVYMKIEDVEPKTVLAVEGRLAQ